MLMNWGLDEVTNAERAPKKLSMVFQLGGECELVEYEVLIDPVGVLELLWWLSVDLLLCEKYDDDTDVERALKDMQ